MVSRFNSDVDNATCLGASNWYYGYDHNEGTNIDLLAVVMHELSHGLGFASQVDQTGAELSGLSDVFTKFIYDETQALYWDEMDDAGRAASSITDQHLVWSGGRTKKQAPTFLGFRPFVRFDGDAAASAGVAGERPFGTAEFGRKLTSPPIVGNVVYVNDGVPNTG